MATFWATLLLYITRSGVKIPYKSYGIWLRLHSVCVKNTHKKIMEFGLYIVYSPVWFIQNWHVGFVYVTFVLHQSDPTSLRRLKKKHQSHAANDKLGVPE